MVGVQRAGRERTDLVMADYLKVDNEMCETSLQYGDSELTPKNTVEVDVVNQMVSGRRLHYTNAVQFSSSPLLKCTFGAASVGRWQLATSADVNNARTHPVPAEHVDAKSITLTPSGDAPPPMNITVDGDALVVNTQLRVTTFARAPLHMFIPST